MKLPIPFAVFRLKALLILFTVFVFSKQSYAQPANDLCANAITLTSGLTCITTTGSIANATFTAAGTPAACVGTVKYDVWFKFTATSANPAINLSNVGANFAVQNPLVQVFSGACGSLVSVGCGAAPYNVTGLAIGTTYYVRVYSVTALPVPATLAAFDICIQDPIPPANDLCAGAVTLTSGASCIATTGTIANATFTAAGTPAACAGTAKYDVWYQFVAQTNNPTITLSNIGANFNAQTPRLQLFSGACGSLVSIGCGTTSYASAGLTPGNTYYVRVYSTTVNPVPATLGNFDICVTDPAPANDLCANAVVLTSGLTCTTTTSVITDATFTAGTPAACSGTVSYDVWFKFTATSANPVVNLSNVDVNFAAQNPLVQVFSGACGSLVSLGCGAAPYNITGLAIGTAYYVRIYSVNGLPAPATYATFDICIQDPTPPANDLCAGAVTLTSGLACTTVTGTVVNATFTAAGTPASCSGTAKYDVWYSFTAQTTNPAITLSNIGANFSAQTPRIQLFSGACGSLTSVGCGTTTYTPAGLTVGATYYIRVYSTTGSPVPATLGNFDICVQNAAAPVNDNCAGATALVSATACSNTAGTLLNSTATAGVPGDCGAVGSPEVWYTFVAQSLYPVITLSSVGAQLTAASPRIQILSGSCGSFTSVACVTGNSLNTLTTNPAGLTVGTTYYVRIYSNSGTMSGANWNFNICITDLPAPVVDYGKSYFNITKGLNGGTIEPGDVLEIRATFVVKGGTAFNVSFADNVPANTTYINNTLRILTNEGQIYKQWTDAADGDPGTITGGAVSINLGSGATGIAGGAVKSTDRPTVFGSTCVMVVSYRVTVNAVAYNSVISVGNGSIAYTNPNNTVNNINFPAVSAVVYKNTGICTNTVGTNGILSESGGTFGSGTLKDRAASSKVPVNYTYVPFTTGDPGDYKYGVTNNTCPTTLAANYSITAGDPVAAHHVFNVWDIIGDHTGATNPLLGNPAADVNNGQSGGYMVVINAAYRTDTAFLDTIKNLCPNTYYEYSAWFRNVCHICSGDSTGKSPTAVGYIPTGPGDSSGVHPNLTFNVNGNDYYTTGDILYTGQWIKKGFTYRTGPAETQMIINIRNNAPGGGGNDWAIDDIGVATCSPTLDLNPSTPAVNVCYGDGASLSADVKSFFDNYTYYIWEKSTDNGLTFTTTAFTGNGTITPVFNGTEYVYTAAGPSFIGDSTTNMNIFRLRVATSAGNLADPNCSFLAVRTVQVLVNNCMFVLKTDLLSASGNLHNNFATIQWKTVNEAGKVDFEIEKSTDGSNFKVMGNVKGNAVNGAGTYTYNDPTLLAGTAYYRIKMIEGTGFKYSKVILLSPDKLHFSVKNLVNPFTSVISFDVVLPAGGNVRTTILDNYGRVVKIYTQQAGKGITPLQIQGTNGLSSGIYSLKVEWQNESFIKRIIKTNNN